MKKTTMYFEFVTENGNSVFVSTNYTLIVAHEIAKRQGAKIYKGIYIKW